MFDYRNNEICARYQRGQTKDYDGIVQLVERRKADVMSVEAPFFVAVALKETDEMVGEIVVMPADGTISLGYTFSYKQHRRGYAFEALSALIRILHEQYPAWDFISFTEPENKPSMELLKKLGYKDLGYLPSKESRVFGKWTTPETEAELPGQDNKEELHMRYGFGVDLGGTTVKIAWFDEAGNMLSKWEIPTVKDNGGTQILPDIAASVLGYLQERTIDRQQVIGIGIGVPGAVNGKGEVNKCINLGWDYIFNIEQALSQRTGFPVKAGNDANVAALGEAWKGGGNGCENMVLATLGTGVGGGIIIDGKLLAGVHGAGGEIGHLVVNPKET